METRKITDIIWREDLYPRFKPSPTKIVEYSEVIELLPPIDIDQHNILIDGYHRLKAHETAKKEEINCNIIQVKSEAELEQLAVQKNSQHGLQLSQKEKKVYAVR